MRHVTKIIRYIMAGVYESQVRISILSEYNPSMTVGRRGEPSGAGTRLSVCYRDGIRSHVPFTLYRWLALKFRAIAGNVFDRSLAFPSHVYSTWLLHTLTRP